MQETEPALNKSQLYALPKHLLQHDMGLAAEEESKIRKKCHICKNSSF